MLDFESLLLDPVYAALGVDATFSKDDVVKEVRVLDHRDGIEQTVFIAGRRAAAMQQVPGLNAEDAVVFVRQAELPDNPRGGTITIDGKPYKAMNALQKGQPGHGEWACVLQEA